MIPVLLLLGCSARSIRAQAELPHHGGLLAAAYPSDAAMALRDGLGVELLLGEEGAGQLPEITLSHAEDAWRPECALSEGALWVACDPIEALPSDAELTLSLTLDTQEVLRRTVSSAVPERGGAWWLSEGLIVDRFGGNDRLISTVEEALQASRLLGAIPGWQPGDDHTGPLLLGQVSSQQIAAPGLTAVLPLAITPDGVLGSGVGDFFLPIVLEGLTLLVLVEDCSIEGVIEEDAAFLHIEGAIPAISLVKLMEPLGELGDVALSLMSLDVDTDGDGDDDAASLSIYTEADEGVLLDW